MILVVLLLLVLLLLSGKIKKPPLHFKGWGLKSIPGTIPLDEAVGQKIEGIYSVKAGKDLLGDLVVLKWTYIIQDSARVHHLSVFSEKECSYIICEGRTYRHKILLNGSWTNPVTEESGEVSLSIRRFRGAGKLLSTKKNRKPFTIIIKGRIVNAITGETKRIVFRYKAPLAPKKDFMVIAHRGGGRNIDFLHASENSIEMIRMASLLGGGGVELDVRLTADKVPVLFHDGVLSAMTIQDYYSIQPVDEVLVADMEKLRLKKGEQIPTLEKALNVILNETTLEMVWLDIKYVGDLQPVRDLQLHYLQLAKEKGRKIDIYLGMPEELIMQNFATLPGFEEIPSLVEMEPEHARALNANVWAPKWTGGLRNKEVEALQQEGRKVFVWTVNEAEYLQIYINRSSYNGVATDAPTLAAFYYYTYGLR